MAKYSEAHKRATAKYQKNAYDKTIIRFRKDGDMTKADVERAAEKQGESMHSYMLNAIRQRLEREQDAFS